jgi:hypothetical protein
MENKMNSDLEKNYQVEEISTEEFARLLGESKQAVQQKRNTEIERRKQATPRISSAHESK